MIMVSLFLCFDIIEVSVLLSQILRRVSLLADAALKLTEADNYNWCEETVKVESFYLFSRRV